ncbi:MAG: hypothetical protein RUMPE_01074 [Eubacteriales bacterium SKADARSKE-1]|nr:hypothetical protein [Eubacteriales bacterium SKADARSKE-1]
MNRVKDRFSAMKKSCLNDDKIHNIEWIILGVIFLLLFLTSCFSDIIATTQHGIIFWDSLFAGRFLDYYIDAVGAIYPFPMYAIFAIWNFPVWVIGKLFSIGIMNSSWLILYSKCILIPFILGTAFLIYKICKELNIKNALWSAFYFLSCCLVMLTICIQAGYDIISVFFTLMGIFYYLKGYTKRFVLFFALAISLKLFALFIFIPLLLLKEKRILRILALLICSGSVYILSFLIFHPMPQQEKNLHTGLMGYLFKNKWPLVTSEVSIFVVAMVCLCFYCYLKKWDETLKIRPIYISFLAMVILFTCSLTHPQWIILLIPYLCILTFAHQDNIKNNILIETLLSGSFALSLMLSWGFVYEMTNINNFLLSKVLGKVSEHCVHYSIGTILAVAIKSENVRSYIGSTLLGIFVASIIVFAVYNYYSLLKRKDSVQGMLIKQESVTSIRTMVWVRAAINFAICSTPACLYFFIKLTGMG